MVEPEFVTRLGHTKLPHMSKPRPVARTLIVLVALVVLVALAAILSMMVGSNPISAPQVVAALVDRASDPGSVVWGSRVPRTVLGLLVGAALGLAGAVMQGQTRNPLADPGVLGVSAGASLAVVAGVYLFRVTSVLGTLSFALVGALVASVVVFSVAALGRDLSSPVPLTIAGTVVSSLLVALTSLLVLRDETTLAAYRIWVVGSLSGRSLDGIGAAALLAALGAVFAALNVSSLNALALGTELATGLGVNLVRARLVGLVAVTMLTASAVAITGPIGFVGLTAPHVARSMVGGNHASLLPASALIGMVVLLLSDVLGRTAGGDGTAEVPVGVVLTVLGGIVFILIVRRVKVAAL